MKANRRIDPVCGCEVDPSHAGDETQFGGQTYYFCSSDHRRQFDEEPRRYTAERPDADLPHEETIPSPRMKDTHASHHTRRRGIRDGQRSADPHSR